jgi:hypothetical protein
MKQNTVSVSGLTLLRHRNCISRTQKSLTFYGKCNHLSTPEHRPLTDSPRRGNWTAHRARRHPWWPSRAQARRRRLRQSGRQRLAAIHRGPPQRASRMARAPRPSAPPRPPTAALAPWIVGWQPHRPRASRRRPRGGTAAAS